MDSQGDAGKRAARVFSVYYAHVLGRKFKGPDWLRYLERLAVTSPEAFAGLVEAITKECRADTDKILRLWGVRR